ncbi:MAG: glycosyltransferase [Candidatus Moranbacteria bacterium]|nr:glycosyltransferase [Candidatus Moranbacteria bacterium]
MQSVLFIVQNLPVPQDRRVWMEARALKKEGYTVSVISPSFNFSKQKKFRKIKGINVYQFKNYYQPGRFLGYFIEYAYSLFRIGILTLKVYFKHNFSVIHVANPPDLLFLIALPFKLLGVKFVYDQHDLNPELLKNKFADKSQKKLALFYKVLLWLEKISLKICDLHITPSKSAQKITLKRNKFKAVSVIVRNAVFRNGNRDKIDKRYLRKVKKFKYVCAYLGVMGSQDGLRNLIRIIDHIVNDHKRSDIGFVLMGDGDELSVVKKRAKKLKLNNNIVFTGWADEKMKNTFLNNADLGLMPDPKNDHSTNSLHNKVLEYMESGLPFVSFDLAETKMIAKKAVIQIKNNNEKRFAKAVIDLINNTKQRKALGKYAQKRVLTKGYTWNESTKNLRLYYKNLLDSKETQKSFFKGPLYQECYKKGLIEIKN